MRTPTRWSGRIATIAGAAALCLGTGTSLAVIGAGGPSAATTPSPTPLGIYVGDYSTSTVSSFPLPSTGDVAPNETFSGSFSEPYGQGVRRVGRPVGLELDRWQQRHGDRAHRCHDLSSHERIADSGRDHRRDS